VATVAAVTSETNKPTSASNYMVMQGDFEYVVGADNLGAISGRAQLIRSALRASSKFSVGLKMASAREGEQLDATVRRYQCDTPSTTPYQDPYQCPGYNQITDANSCDSSAEVEPRFSCTVGASSCDGEYDWGVYIPEEFEGQRLVDLSVMLSVNGNAFACANLKITRDVRTCTCCSV
jgi:hypothetical protein